MTCRSDYWRLLSGGIFACNVDIAFLQDFFLYFYFLIVGRMFSVISQKGIQPLEGGFYIIFTDYKEVLSDLFRV